VLDPSPPAAAARGRTDAARRERLARLESGAASERLLVWIEEARERGASDEELARRAGTTPEAVRAELSDALAKGTIHALRRSPDRYIAEAPLARLASRAPVEIQALAAAGAGAVGASRRTLLQRLVPGADPRWAEAIEAALVARGSIVLAGEEARVPGRDELPATERDLASRIAGLYSERALDPPSPAEAATVLNHRQKVVEGLGCKFVRVHKQEEIAPAIRQAERWLDEFKVPVVIEVMLERVTNISMGTEIDAVNEFEELALSKDDAPTAIGLLD